MIIKFLHAPKVVPLRLQLQAELFSSGEIDIFRHANRVSLRIPHRRAIWETIRLAQPKYEIHGVDLVRGIVVHKLGGEAGNVVDRRAIFDDEERR